MSHETLQVGKVPASVMGNRRALYQKRWVQDEAPALMKSKELRNYYGPTSTGMSPPAEFIQSIAELELRLMKENQAQEPRHPKIDEFQHSTSSSPSKSSRRFLSLKAKSLAVNQELEAQLVKERAEKAKLFDVVEHFKAEGSRVISELKEVVSKLKHELSEERKRNAELLFKEFQNTLLSLTATLKTVSQNADTAPFADLETWMAENNDMSRYSQVKIDVDDETELTFGDKLSNLYEALRHAISTASPNPQMVQLLQKLLISLLKVESIAPGLATDEMYTLFSKSAVETSSTGSGSFLKEQVGSTSFLTELSFLILSNQRTSTSYKVLNTSPLQCFVPSTNHVVDVKYLHRFYVLGWKLPTDLRFDNILLNKEFGCSHSVQLTLGCRGLLRDSNNAGDIYSLHNIFYCSVDLFQLAVPLILSAEKVPASWPKLVTENILSLSIKLYLALHEKGFMKTNWSVSDIVVDLSSHLVFLPLVDNNAVKKICNSEDDAAQSFVEFKQFLLTIDPTLSEKLRNETEERSSHEDLLSRLLVGLADEFPDDMREEFRKRMERLRYIESDEKRNEMLVRLSPVKDGHREQCKVLLEIADDLVFV